MIIQLNSFSNWNYSHLIKDAPIPFFFYEEIYVLNMINICFIVQGKGNPFVQLAYKL